MSGTMHYNGQIPTDPTIALVLLLALICAAGQLTPDQAEALIATGGIAELALMTLRGGR